MLTANDVYPWAGEGVKGYLAENARDHWPATIRGDFHAISRSKYACQELAGFTEYMKNIVKMDTSFDSPRFQRGATKSSPTRVSFRSQAIHEKLQFVV